MKGKEFYFILTAAEESVPMMERTVECFRGLLDCLEDPREKGVVYGAGHGVPATSRGCPRWMRPMPWGAAYKRIENYGL